MNDDYVHGAELVERPSHAALAASAASTAATLDFTSTEPAIIAALVQLAQAQ